MFSFICCNCFLIILLFMALAHLLVSFIPVSSSLISTINSLLPKNQQYCQCCSAPASMQLVNKPPDVTHASVPPICIFMKRSEFCFWHTGAWCITTQGALFFHAQRLTQSQSCTHLSSIAGTQQRASPVMIHCRGTLPVLAPRLVQFLCFNRWLNHPSFCLRGPLSILCVQPSMNL